MVCVVDSDRSECGRGRSTTGRTPMVVVQSDLSSLLVSLFEGLGPGLEGEAIKVVTVGRADTELGGQVGDRDAVV